MRAFENFGWSPSNASAFRIASRTLGSATIRWLAFEAPEERAGLALALEVATNGFDRLGLDQLGRTPELHHLGVGGHPFVPVRLVVVHHLLQLPAHLVEVALGEVGACLVRHAERLQLLQSVGYHLVEGVADRDDLVGERDLLPLHVGVVGVLVDVGVLLGHHFHVREPEVLTDRLDLLGVAAGRGRHPGDERVGRVGVVALGDVDVRVVAGRAVTLVEGAVGHVAQRDPVADQIVLDDLRSRDHDPGVVPERGAIVGFHVAGEHDDLVVRNRERLAVEVGVLLDEGFCGG